MSRSSTAHLTHLSCNRICSTRYALYFKTHHVLPLQAAIQASLFSLSTLSLQIVNGLPDRWLLDQDRVVMGRSQPPCTQCSHNATNHFLPLQTAIQASLLSLSTLSFLNVIATHNPYPPNFFCWIKTMFYMTEALVSRQGSHVQKLYPWFYS
jgi:hypothetical protein